MVARRPLWGRSMRTVDRLDVQHSIYRAAGMVRAALLAATFVVNLVRVTEALHPLWLIGVTAAMLGWTGATWVWNQQPERRTLPWMSADVVFTLVMVGSSRLILGESVLSRTFLGVTVYWMVCAPIVIGIWKGPVAGALCGAVIGAVNFVQVPTANPRAWLDVTCMIMIPALGGLIADELSHLMRQRERNNAVTASLAERDRMNRIVHDGVLQVLAMVEREGSSLGPRGAELAGLAYEQEVRLRDMLQGRMPTSQGGSVDLVGLLARRARADVSVSSVVGRLLVPSHVAEELDAAVGEVLANVRRHAGPGAKAWILIEDDDAEVVVSVRDDGVGMTDDDVLQAAGAGHQGVKESIEGRVKALGGIAGWRSQGGVEWEMRVPKERTW